MSPFAASLRFSITPYCRRRAVNSNNSVRWKSIRLELSNTRDFPTGSVGRAYLLRMPFDDEQRIDAEAVRQSPTRATVRRHWSAEPDEDGVLVQDGPDWAMRSEGKQRLIRFHARSLRTGQPVSIVDVDGAILPFRVASIR